MFALKEQDARTAPYARELHPGMGQAVAERTILRKVTGDDGATRYETWAEVAKRVSIGNALLCPKMDDFHDEQEPLERHLANATILMSGRHLQHGDETQPSRNAEVFTNCATAATSFLLFQLLLNGSGVGRCYNDELMLTNWNYAPNLRVVLDTTHADFDWSQDESLRDAQHKYAGDKVVWHEVADTREGWAKAVELWEVMAYQKVYVAHTLVLDFSKVRPKGSPIKGMQDRPSSGPKPLMNALMKCASIKGAGMTPWRQAMYVDHYLAECVLVGGARRAARMSMKHWGDKDILEFIRVKRPIEYQGLTMQEVLAKRAASPFAPFSFLWSSNNSVAVDAEFWAGLHEFEADFRTKGLSRNAKRAWRVLNAICEAAYGDGTGEPGLINVDKLAQNDTGWEAIAGGDFVGSHKYQVEDETRLLLARLAKIAKTMRHYHTTNPCGEISLSVLGAYCCIADVVPFHADTLDEAEEAFRVATRALIRVNLMDCLYAPEVKRTNRIGVGMTGVHEFAWKFFKVGFRDLIDPDWMAHTSNQGLPIPFERYSNGARAAEFWATIRRFSNAVKDEAARYAKELGVVECHTSVTIKPAGTTSKLFGLTEGWHLPALAWYMRWVQFRSDDPLVETYRKAGYQVRELKTYSGTTIVGFPTQPAIGSLGMGDALVTANDATPEEQYQWLHLGEAYWLGAEKSNQISYTLKYNPNETSYEAFRSMLIKHQSQIRCCSVLPITDSSAYEYLPEEAITKAKYEELIHAVVNSHQTEDIAFEHIDCDAGGCPIDFNTEDKI
jgi:adenosylcobalamin-dependent ribonucleoside-triphosphate reductase